MTLAGVKLVDRYVLERRIGQGGSADVYRAKDTRLDRVVSVKVLNPAAAADPDFRRRLRREAKSASALSHPGIVRVLDAGEDEVSTTDGKRVVYAFIVMEYVAGIELTKVIAKGPLKVAEALRIAKEVAEAVAFAHKKHIVHRDITSNNVMVTKTGGAKVLDFGIALANADFASESTQALSVVGTPAYFSPEQASGEAGDERSDIYSIGVVLFEMLTGRVPFIGGDAVHVARAHMNEFAPAPSSLNPKVPLRVDMIVERALSKVPAARYATASDFATDLANAYEGLEASDTVSNSGASTVASSSQTESLSPNAATTMTSVSGRETASSADDFDAVFSPRTTYSGGSSWSVEEMSGLGARKSPQRRRVLAGILVSLLTVSVLSAVTIWVVNLAPANIFPTSGVTIPVVTNLTYEQAAAKLRALEFLPVEEDEYSTTVPLGKVIRTEPAVGQTLEVGQVITVIVSLGPEESAVPNVVGMVLSDATAALTSANLVGGTVTESYHGSYAAGTVIATDPVPGTFVAKGGVVNIVVANGKVDVPDVRGKSLTDATSLLSSPAYMVPVVTTADRSCRSDSTLVVSAQSVLGEASVGTSVTLYYCAG